MSATIEVKTTPTSAVAEVIMDNQVLFKETSVIGEFEHPTEVAIPSVFEKALQWGHNNGRLFDSETFEAFWKECQELNNPGGPHNEYDPEAYDQDIRWA